MIEHWMNIICAVFRAESNLQELEKWEKRLEYAKTAEPDERESICDGYVRAIAEEIIDHFGMTFEDDSKDRLLEKGVRVISELFGVNIKSRSRSRDVVDLRCMYCYWMRNNGCSLNEIGKYLGLDHSTVHHNFKKMSGAMDVPESWQELMGKYERFNEAMKDEG